MEGEEQSVGLLSVICLANFCDETVRHLTLYRAAADGKVIEYGNEGIAVSLDRIDKCCDGCLFSSFLLNKIPTVAADWAACKPALISSDR